MQLPSHHPAQVAAPFLELERVCRQRPLNEQLRRHIQMLMLEMGIRSIRVGPVVFEAVPLKPLKVQPLHRERSEFVRRCRRTYLQARMWLAYWQFRSRRAEANWLFDQRYENEGEEAWEAAQYHKQQYKRLRRLRGAA